MNGLLKDVLKDWRVWVILVMGLILWLSSCSTPDNATPRLRLYTARAGQHDFTPSPLPIPGEARTLEGTAKFMPSCWYDNLGEDQSDWNKLAGVYKWSDVVKNKNSVILAWRPDIKIRDMFDLILYENIDGANVPKESGVYKIKAGEEFRFMFAELGGQYLLYINGTLLGTQANDIDYKVIGKISAWFGGNRTAPWDMHIYMNF